METEPNKPKKWTCRRGKCVATILVVLIFGATCCYFGWLQPIDPKPGMRCEVRFKWDIGGPTLVSVEGTLVAIDREKVILNSHLNKQWWIPRNNILCIVTYPNPK